MRERLQQRVGGMVGEIGTLAGRVVAASQEMTVSAQQTGTAIEELAKATTTVAEGSEKQVSLLNRVQAATGEAVEKAAGARRGFVVVARRGQKTRRVRLQDSGRDARGVQRTGRWRRERRHIDRSGPGGNNQVAAVAGNTSASTEQVSASAEQSAASSTQISTAGEELVGMASQLSELVGAFTV